MQKSPKVTATSPLTRGNTSVPLNPTKITPVQSPNTPAAKEDPTKTNESSQLRVESLAGCEAITDDGVKKIIATLKKLDDNESRLAKLETEKNPFTFNSANVLAIMGVTNSIKTKLAIIQMLSQRLMDPALGE
jgi:hypothetical protein